MADASSSTTAITAPFPPCRPFQPQMPRNATIYDPVQFSQSLFRGPDDRKVKILYSQDLVTSELIARLFRNEAIVGFDMEWIYPAPADPTLQELVSLIQVASEDKVALFHIGRHAGNTPDELIAPSLRRLIENHDIRKTGQSIMGDCARLRDYFGLHARALSELSYFHILVSNDPGSSMTTRYVRGGLRFFVEHYFPGLTLEKDSTMHEEWTQPLNERHRNYAAADVYASLMVWHRMNAARLVLYPRPPLPRNADEYLRMDYGRPGNDWVEVEPLAPGAMSMAACHFFQLHEDIEDEDDSFGPEHLNNTVYKLYRRLSRARMATARRLGIKPWYIANNYGLRVMAEEEPQTEEECCELLGPGPRKHLIFMEMWVHVIHRFIENGRDEDLSEDEAEIDNGWSIRQVSSENPASAPPMISSHQDAQPGSNGSNGISRLQILEASEQLKKLVKSSSTAPVPAIARAHTGLSFSMADTSIGIDESPAPEESSLTKGGDTEPSSPAATVPQLHTSLTSPMADAKVDKNESLAPIKSSSTEGEDTEPSSPVAAVSQLRTSLSFSLADANISNDDGVSPKEPMSTSSRDMKPSSPIAGVSQLHTGLSFSMAETHIGDEERKRQD